MPSDCGGCGNKEAYHVRYYGDGTQICNKCGLNSTLTVPDVYWDGKPEENLANDPSTGKPRVFLSKLDKARYLQERGIMEAGDRIHGAPIQVSRMKPERDTRQEVRMALKKVREMGIDVRRQEYLRIKKEGMRHA